jgi:hypothetical protein
VSLVQQPAIAVWIQFSQPTHLSIVHGFLSSHIVSETQPGQHEPSIGLQTSPTGQTIAVCVHALLEHPSIVQALLSLQSAAVMQYLHPAIGVCTHALFTHVSVVHTLLSLQSAAVLQHPGIIAPGPILKLALKPGNGPSTMGVPFMPSPFTSLDIYCHTVQAALDPHEPVHKAEGANTAFGVHTFTTSMFVLGP